MGGNPCRLKEILDQGNAAQRALGCMGNTAFIASAATTGKATVSAKLAEDFSTKAKAFALVCGDVEAELAGFLPPDEPGG